MMTHLFHEDAVLPHPGDAKRVAAPRQAHADTARSALHLPSVACIEAQQRRATAPNVTPASVVASSVTFLNVWLVACTESKQQDNLGATQGIAGLPQVAQ
jgi:hypothetical protein